MFPLCFQKEPEFLDVLESCSLTWLTDGNQSMSESVHRTTEEIHTTQPLHHTSSSSSSSSSSSCMSPAVAEERQVEAGSGRNGDSSTGGSSDLLPPEFFELLSEGGVGTMDSSGVGYYYHHQHHHANNVQPASPSASEEELPCVPDSPSCSSSASQSPSQNCSPPSSPVSSPSVYLSSRLGKRKRTAGERANSALSSFSSSMQRSPYSSTKKSRKEREQENERKVQELTEQNERLKAEIERLGEEVQRTRRALIERLVNTRKWEAFEGGSVEAKWKMEQKHICLELLVLGKEVECDDQEWLTEERTENQRFIFNVERTAGCKDGKRKKVMKWYKEMMLQQHCSKQKRFRMWIKGEKWISYSRFDWTKAAQPSFCWCAGMTECFA